MKTYVNTKTGNRYPEHGCASSFTTWSNGKAEYFIKPGYPECSKGWKKYREKDWSMEEIPDLAKPYTREQWLTYAITYGTPCAQEFLECCDYSKPRSAYRMFHPPTGEWSKEVQAWFKATFRADIFNFICGYAMTYGNRYALDVLKFERLLERDWGYPAGADGSMRDFVAKRFGPDSAARLQGILSGDSATIPFSIGI